MEKNINPQDRRNPSLNSVEGAILNQDPDMHKCAVATCNRTHCRTPWHKPCVLAKLGLVEKLRPMLVVVSGMEIIVGIILLISMVLCGRDYDVLFGTEDLEIISQACLSGSIALIITGLTLIISMYWKIRRLMLVNLFISTILGVYFFVISIFKIHYGLKAINRVDPDGSCRVNQSFLTSAACLMGLLTLLGCAVHFIGNIVVFTYYNLKYVQPCLFKSMETA